MLRKGYILRDPAQDLKWNMCHITNPTAYENHSKILGHFFNPKLPQIFDRKFGV